MELQSTEFKEKLSKDLEAKIHINYHYSFVTDDCLITARRYYPELKGYAEAYYLISPELIEDGLNENVYHLIASDLDKTLIHAAFNKIGVNYDG